MQIASIVDPELVLFELEGVSKKRLFEQVAAAVSDTHSSLPEKAIFEGLFARERLGSTAIGEGVAIPHCRLADASDECCALVKLKTAIEFDAPDDRPVDILIFLIVAGEASQSHLDRLAIISRALSDADLRAQIRSSDSLESLQAVLSASS